MITYEQFDINIDQLHGDADIYFEFDIEKEIKKPYSIYIIRDHDSGKETDRFKIVHFLYGRIRIGNDSYFTEVIGYHHPDAPLITTYHIVSIFDQTFYEKYSINYSYSDFSEDDFFEYL